MLFLPLGISYLYASATSRNPGHLDQASVKNEDDTSPRTVSLKVDDNSKVDILKLCLRNIFSTHRIAFKFASCLLRSLLISV